jgi:TetR/AcrR family transcriptional repressor of nem operon
MKGALFMATKGERTREKILRSAIQVFNRQGFGTTTISDLLDATGTTKGNLYFHFASKEELGLEVFRRASESFARFLDESLRDENPGAGLDNFFRHALKKHQGNGFVGGCLFGNTALEASDTDPELTALVSDVFAGWIGRLKDAIALAQSAGQIRQDLPAGDLAELVVATIEGGIMQARMKKDEGPLSRTLDTLRVLLGLKTSPEQHH